MRQNERGNAMRTRVPRDTRGPPPQLPVLRVDLYASAKVPKVYKGLARTTSLARTPSLVTSR